MKDQYRFLGHVDEMVGLTGIEIEYDKLETTVHRRGTKTFGTLTMNKSKNRYANIDMIPCKFKVTYIRSFFELHVLPWSLYKIKVEWPNSHINYDSKKWYVCRSFLSTFSCDDRLPILNVIVL